jgi:hypothetical protein
MVIEVETNWPDSIFERGGGTGRKKESKNGIRKEMKNILTTSKAPLCSASTIKCLSFTRD